MESQVSGAAWRLHKGWWPPVALRAQQGSGAPAGSCMGPLPLPSCLGPPAGKGWGHGAWRPLPSPGARDKVVVTGAVMFVT